MPSQQYDPQQAREDITDALERAAATANLIAAGSESDLAGRQTITHAAFHLFRDLQDLKREFERYDEHLHRPKLAPAS